MKKYDFLLLYDFEIKEWIFFICIQVSFSFVYFWIDCISFSRPALHGDYLLLYLLDKDNWNKNIWNCIANSSSRMRWLVNIFRTMARALFTQKFILQTFTVYAYFGCYLWHFDVSAKIHFSGIMKTYSSRNVVVNVRWKNTSVWSLLLSQPFEW